jgi:protein-tyrosine phosphatase
MAWGFLQARLRERKIRTVWVESAGTSGWDGGRPTAEAVEAAAEHQADISSHRARRLEADMAEAADVIVAMSTEHREAVEEMSADAAARTFTIKELVRVLDDFPGHPDDTGSAEERMRRAVSWARERRSSPEAPESAHEDIADPLGLSLASYRATAWELETLCQKLMDGLFGPGWVEPPAFDSAILWGTSATKGGGP